MRELLFIGGPIDGQRMWVDNSAQDVRWPKSNDMTAMEILKDDPGTPPKPTTLEDETVTYERLTLIGGYEVMFHDEGTPLVRKLIEGYKRP